MNSYFLIFLGGGFGSIARFLCSKWLPYTENSFPWATFLANTLACVVLSLTFSLISKFSIANNDYRLFIITGFCGGFSTFSTFSFETVRLLQSSHYLIAFSYVFLSFFVGVASIFFIIKYLA